MRSKSFGRPAGRLFYLAIILLAATGVRAQTTPATTLIQDTVYRANGTPAGGSLVISWPAFETLDHKTVAAGLLGVKLGDDGSLNVPLVPNQGATPEATYYTVVVKLDDGTTRTEFWNVPNISPATVADVRTAILPKPVEYTTENHVQQAEVSSDPLPNKIPRAGNDGKLPEAWIPNTVAGPLVHDANSDILSCPTCMTTDGIETATGNHTFSAPAGASITANGGNGDNDFAIRVPTGKLYVGPLEGWEGNAGAVVNSRVIDPPGNSIAVQGLVQDTNASNVLWGMSAVVTSVNDTGNRPNAVGIEAFAEHDGQGIANNLMSGMFSGYSSGGTIWRYMGVNVQGIRVDGGHILDSYGVYAAPPLVTSGTVERSYGIYTEDFGDQYALYLTGGKSYFGGPILLNNRSQPPTPAAGQTALYVDSGTKKLCEKDDTGTASCLVRSASELSDGTTGTGSVMLSNAPAATGTMTAETVNAQNLAVASLMNLGGPSNAPNIAQIQFNPGQVNAGVTGSLLGIAHSANQWLLEMDTAGNVGVQGYVSAAGGLKASGLAANSGTRFVCVDTEGKFVSSVTPCSGT